MQPCHPARGKQLIVALAALLSVFLMPATATAQPVNAAERGKAVIDKWCRMCHVRTDAEKSPDMAPPFREIVRRPGRNPAYLRKFLDEDHFPMSTYRLFDHEKDEVVAYLMSLKPS
ncbi:MAG: cytochrome c [Fimbriimonadaceae bacterium]|nr:cytochrome c [Alphaproteobacteria bacterium]